MELNVGKELATLNRMPVLELRAKYAEVFGEATNARHKAWLVKRIIWRMQALAAIVSIICLRFSGSLVSARTLAAASIALSFSASSPALGFAVLARGVFVAVASTAAFAFPRFPFAGAPAGSRHFAQWRPSSESAHSCSPPRGHSPTGVVATSAGASVALVFRVLFALVSFAAFFVVVFFAVIVRVLVIRGDGSAAIFRRRVPPAATPARAFRLYGHRDFVCLIGSDEGHAMDMLDSIKMELDGNDLLLEDFPEVVFPIQALDGIANRCNGQLYQGERTHIGWTAREIVLPTMPGSQASGAIIKVAGITGRRGWR